MSAPQEQGAGGGSGDSSPDFDALAEVYREVTARLVQDEAPNATLTAELNDNSGGAAHGYFAEPHAPHLLGEPVSAVLIHSGVHQQITSNF